MTVAVEETDLSSLPADGPLLQSEVWARFKAEFGWQTRAFAVGAGPWEGTTILTLTRSLGPGLRLAYVPYAPPELPTAHDSWARDLAELGASLSRSIAPAPMCLRFDLTWARGTLSPRSSGSGSEVVHVATGGLRKSPVNVQPASTVIVDLQQDEDAILAGMHKKNRYNVRLSERKGVVVRQAGIEALGQWYAIYRETAERDRITIHPERYYRRLFELAEERSEIALRLYLASHKDDLLAGIIVAEFGTRATYLYGASRNAKRELMPNYALQWTAMRNARHSGMSSYDLFGVPPADDPSHPMHGLYRFKTGFGGVIENREGSWDVTVQPLRYGAYSAAERARAFYFHRVRKTIAR